MTDSISSTADHVTQEARQWAMFLHFSVFLGYVAPLAGFIAPIVIWQLKKDQLPWVDEHGKIVTNWILSSLIWWIVSGILCLVAIGIPLLAAMGIVSVIFPLIGGIKANNGETWTYPLSIRFFS